jgi:membrane protein implicated in regulation of membrane protease activity
MMDGAMMDGMASMMAWAMGLGLLGWVAVIVLLAIIAVLLVQLLRHARPRERPGSRPPPAKH